ncbi:hypothetical protein O1611_g5609 [Lasiodiplodia mahajangana]|uniref:Uncharacterized protein n=1 Tax=Lasiodiplodia mahajangana TaxID=1108764 RepID=A0ACC2JKJ8_9PEZI|nr:hypothetical protein O1611_g5609 [Lasiodiplodia mahajangana]
MTTATSIGNIYLCCHSDLTYSSSQGYEECAGTKTSGVGFLGYFDGEVAAVRETTSFSAADNMTVHVYASPVYLIQEGITTGISSTRSSASTTPDPSNSPGPIGPDAGASSQTGIKVGASLGAVVLALILFTLVYILLVRYRRRRLLSRHQPLNPHSSTPDRTEAETILKIRQKRHLPELPMIELPAELDGVQVESRGPGIYVWKPELEGTAGVDGLVGVYVREKAELEANRKGVASSVMGISIDFAENEPGERDLHHRHRHLRHSLLRLRNLREDQERIERRAAKAQRRKERMQQKAAAESSDATADAGMKETV